MIMRGRDRSGGFSLVELLVVMAIVAILMGISIPILQMFSQNEMDRGARALYTMVRSARVYASTYNVRTAVVYRLDSDPAGKPVMDSLRLNGPNASVRVLRAATVLYQLPSNMGSYKGLYVPTPDYGGEFQPFSPDYGVLLDVPPQNYQMPPVQTPAFSYGIAEDPSSGANIGWLGMSWVRQYDGPVEPGTTADENSKVWLMGHVFDPGGRLEVGGSNATTQRFSVLYAPMPDRPVADRTWSSAEINDTMISAWWGKTNPDDLPQMGLIGIPIEIYRSTGRVRMGSL